MAALDKFERVNQKISEAIEWVGLAAIVLMMLITTVDVLGAKLFRAPVFGSLDIMMIAQLVAMSFSAAVTLIISRHVQVDFFVMLLPKRLQDWIGVLVNLLGFVLFAVVVWQLCAYAYDLQTGGEVSSTARIPLHPFAYGAALALVPVCLVHLAALMRAISRNRKNDA